MGQLADAADDLEEFRARQTNVVLVGLRQELLKVRELALDQPRREEDRPCSQDGLVAKEPTETCSTPSAGDDAAQLTQRSGGDVGLQLTADAGLQLGSLDGQPVGVGRDHRHLLTGRGDQDPGKDGAHVVA